MSDTLERQHFYIDGSWVSPSDPAGTIEVSNAADGSLLATIPAGGPADVDAAVSAARSAFPEWARTSPAERASFLRALRDALADRQETIAWMVALEVGTPLNIAQRIQAGLPLMVLGTTADHLESFEWESTIANSTVVREPIGVIGAISPWNYPLHQLVAKVAGALAAGCTVVAKPSSVAPLSAFVLAEATEIAGLPPGVFNLVTGSGSVVGEALAGHPGIDALSFTGSTEVGSRVASLGAANITKVSLELGGKSANVILDDADFGRAVKTGVGNAFLNSGQTCSAWTRMLVPAAHHDEIVDLAVAASERLVVGHPLEEGTRLGPLSSAQQQRIVRDYIEVGQHEGADLVVGGTEMPDGLNSGYFITPTIFANVDSRARVAQEEIFGPVLSIIPFESDDHAVEIANDSEYGLAGGVWSADEERAMSVARRMRTGQVDINGGAFNPAAPFGGYKKSGIGRELGPFGIEEFLEVKSIQR